MQKLAIPANPDGTMYIYASQGENKARSYEVTIIDISGKPVELDGTTAVFYVHKGKNIVQIPMEIEGNTATATLTSGACDVPGDHPCWVQVIKPDTYDLRVDGLVLRVQACDIEGAVDASDEWGELTQLIVQAQQAIEGANNAAGQAQTAADNANTAANAASIATDTANAAANNAESATTAANNAASQATTAASDAQTKGGYAQTQGDAAKAIVEQWEGVGLDDFVPITRTVNGKPLSSDIILSPADVGAQPQTTARKTMVKADESGELIEAADGVDYFSPASLDPQWTFPTLQNGYTADEGQPAWTPRYGKSGNVVEVSGLFKTWAKDKSAFVLPEGYRPNNNITSAQMVCTRGGTIKRPALMTITSNGSVQVYNTADNGDEWLFFHCTFITA